MEEEEEEEADIEGACRPEFATINFSGVIDNGVPEAVASGRADPETDAEGDAAVNQRPSPDNHTSQLLMQEHSDITVNCAGTMEDEGEETEVEGVCGPEFVTIDFSSVGDNRVPEAAG